jgi:hypothetical protein
MVVDPTCKHLLGGTPIFCAYNSEQQGRSQDPAAGGWLHFLLLQPLPSFFLLEFIGEA